MKTVSIIKEGKRHKFEIPTKWEDVSIEQFCKTFTIDRENMLDMEVAIEYAVILTDIPRELLYDLTTPEFQLISENLEFINTSVDSNMKESVMVEGEEYFLHNDFQNYTFGEQITAEIILDKNQGNLLGCMDQLLCVMLRKKVDGKIEKYDTSFKERGDMFKQIPITDIYQLFSFFINSKGV